MKRSCELQILKSFTDLISKLNPGSQHTRITIQPLEICCWNMMFR